jgi:hypothetical protein
LQSAVSQNCILQTDRNCRSMQVSSDSLQVYSLQLIRLARRCR